MIQYLSKFLPHLSDMTKPLRDLTQQDVEWCWGDGQDSALKQIKEAVTHTPVLQYYNLEDEVTLQCDASQHGLGAVLLQKGQPVASPLQALTPTEFKYAQIEKELLAIVFACERFKVYIFGHDLTTWRQITSHLRPSSSIPCMPPLSGSTGCCCACKSSTCRSSTKR